MVKRVLFVLLAASQINVIAQAADVLTEADFLQAPPIVLTASRMVQSVMDAPNAVTVLDRETIVSSGYKRIADLLRLVPGIFVGDMNGWKMVVSHSFVDQLEHRMQVMIDGRSVYLPTFGGVDWDSLPLGVDDIERIEVVRGPNAASYGANAFTGIINIISRHPADQTGKRLELIYGNDGEREGWFRWSGGSDRIQQRISVGHKESQGFIHQVDDSLTNLFNYRADVNLDTSQSLSVQLSASDGVRQDGDTGPDRVSNTAFQADYRRQVDESKSLLIKIYDTNQIDKVVRPASPSSPAHLEDQIGERRHLEFQFDQESSPTLRTTLGGYMRQDIVRSRYYFNSNQDRSVDSEGVFGVVDWRLAPHWLINTGAFYEYYVLVGSKLSPRFVLSWQPTENHTFRAGVSRAYRNPVLYEDAGVYHVSTLILPIGNANLLPESLLSREVGYLGRWPEWHLNVDLRLFKEDFDNYIGFYANKSTGQIHIDNWGNAKQAGGELQVKWQPLPHTQVIGNYAEFNIDSPVLGSDKVGESAPHHISGLHLMHRLPYDIDANLSEYWVSSLVPIEETHAVPAYKRLDFGLHKHLKIAERQALLGLTWQNLTGGYYSLFKDGAGKGLVGRNVALNFQLEF